MDEGRLKSVIVVGVKYLDSYRARYSCKRKVQISGSIGECGRCGISLRKDRCTMAETACQIDVEENNSVKSLTAFFPISEEICQGDVTKKALLGSQPFHL